MQQEMLEKNVLGAHTKILGGKLEIRISELSKNSKAILFVSFSFEEGMDLRNFQLLDEIQRVNFPNLKVFIIPRCDEAVKDAEIEKYLRENHLHFTTLERADMNCLQSHPVYSRLNMKNIESNSVVLVTNNGDIFKSYDKNV